MQVTMTVNGDEVTREIEPRLLLVHFLRDTLGLTGTHWGCDTSNCGTCVVLMDGEPVKSCTVLAAMAGGPRDPHGRGPRAGRRARPRPAGLHGGARPAVRLLHAGHDADRARAARPQPGPHRGARSARRSRARSAAARATRTSSGRSAGRPSTRSSRPRPGELSSWPRVDRRTGPIGYGRHRAQGGPALHPRQGQLRRRRRAARACCTARCCAARSRTRASCRSTPPPRCSTRRCTR